jgi:sec-independent protein translocase protein TatA
MGELRPWHIIVLVVVVFVLFGYKKLPDATRSLGRSLRILKTEVKSLHDDDDAQVAAEQPAAPRAVEAPRAPVPDAGTPAVPPVTSDSDRR